MYYLRKYVGNYRVKADYDKETKDFPRLEDGSIDPSFDDLYIDCKNKIEIRHVGRNVLWCYIPSKQRGMNILREIYTDNMSQKLPKDKDGYLENLCKELVDKKILVNAEVLDYEVLFEFKADMIDYIAKLVGAKTTGKSINPFSTKNLPREPYKIPDKDMRLYKESIKNLPQKTMEINGKSRTMVDGLIIRQLNKSFDKIIKKSKSKKFDVDKDRKSKGLKNKEYIHSLGEDMWVKYCEFLKSYKEE